MVRHKNQLLRGDGVGAICGISVKTHLAIKGSNDGHHSMQSTGRFLLGRILIIPSIKILKPGESCCYQQSYGVEGRASTPELFLCLSFKWPQGESQEVLSEESQACLYLYRA